MRIVLIGNTGSGKSTVARQLVEYLHVPRVSSGDIARMMSEADPDLAQALKAGLPGPEVQMRAHVQQALERAEIEHGGWVLEGFPYMTEQLICLMQWTSVVPVFMHLILPEWAAIERLLARGRPDDNADSIALKLKRFNDHTRPMLSILASGHRLRNIDASGDPEDVLDDCLRKARLYGG